MHLRPLALAPLLAALGCAHATPLVTAPEPAAPLTVFHDVTLFSGANAQATPHQDVWVRGETIEAVKPTGEAAPAGAVVVEGAGLTLMPGLIDLHVHSSTGPSVPWEFHTPDPERNLQSYLYAGITTAADMAGSDNEVAERRAAIREGRLLGPRLLIAGKPFTAPRGHPVALIKLMAPWPLGALLADGFAYQVETAADADRGVDQVLKIQPDYIKLMCDQIPLGIPSLKAEAAREVVARAHAAGKKAVAHVGSNADAQEMAEAGVDIFVHDVYREPLQEEVAELLAQKHIPVAPTLAVFDDADRLAARDLHPGKISREVADPRILRAVMHPPEGYQPPEEFQTWLAAVHQNRQAKLQNVALLRKHGVTILVGSDAPNLAHFPGGALHDELDLLVQSGMTPGEVLHAATLVNATALGLEKEVGSVEPGKRADLLLLRGDPTADIANAHEIEAVYLGGRKLARASAASR